MKIDALCWENVSVTCPSDPSKSHKLGRCYVEVHKDKMMWISGKAAGHGLVFGSIELVELNCTSATFTGRTSTDERPGGTLLPVEIVCRF